MELYSLSFILTVPLYSFSIYMLFCAFLGSPRVKTSIVATSYISFSLGISFVFLLETISIFIILYNIVFIFLMSILYEASYPRRIATSLSILIIGLSIEVIFSIFFGFIKFDLFIQSPNNSSVGIIVIRVVTVIVSILIYRYKSSDRNNSALPNYYYVVHLLILFGILYLFVVSVNGKDIGYSQILISGAIMIAVVTFIHIIEIKLNSLYLLEIKKKIVEEQELSFENQKEIIAQSLVTINSIKHDMKNHILAIASLKNSDKEAAQHYINKILKEIEQDGKLANSNNFIIDNLINQKLQCLKDKDIKIEIDVTVPIDIRLTAYDMTVILGNLLDNSVRAVVEGTKEKFLTLKIFCKKGNLIILIDNSYNGVLKKYKGRLKSTKINNSNHGIGLKNIKNTVEKCCGEMFIKHTKSKFSVSVILPL